MKTTGFARMLDSTNQMKRVTFPNIEEVHLTEPRSPTKYKKEKFPRKITNSEIEWDGPPLPAEKHQKHDPDAKEPGVDKREFQKKSPSISKYIPPGRSRNGDKISDDNPI